MEEEKTKQTETQIPEEIRPVKKQRWFSKSLHDFLGGDYLSKQSVLGNLPYLLFITILALVYIGNTYYAEKTYKEIEKTKNELKELRFQYLTVKSSLMYHTKMNEIVRRATPLGLKEAMLPPYKIYYSDKSLVASGDTSGETK